MKRVVLIAVLALLTIIVGCDKQKALDSILADPQMRSHLLHQMLSDETSRAEMADSILNDVTITDVYLSGLAENELSRIDLLERLIAVDSTGEWTVGKLAENAEIKKVMKKASKR
ncbi:MAG: hypothetical protein V3W18_07340 [candidate division Zixibacteria bacterium]